jgi:hypothetical protein
MSHAALNEVNPAASTRLAWHQHDWGDVGWMWLWGGLMMVVWAALIAAAIWLVATRTGPHAARA